MIKKLKIKIICITASLISTVGLAFLGWGIQKYKKNVSSSSNNSPLGKNFENYNLHSSFLQKDLNTYFENRYFDSGRFVVSLNTDDVSNKLNNLFINTISSISMFKSDIGSFYTYIDYYIKDEDIISSTIFWSKSSKTYINNTTDSFYYDSFDLFVT